MYYLHGREVRKSVGVGYQEALRARASVADVQAGRLGLRPQDSGVSGVHPIDFVWTQVNQPQAVHLACLRDVPEVPPPPPSSRTIRHRRSTGRWSEARIAKKAKSNGTPCSKRKSNASRPTLSKKSVPEHGGQAERFSRPIPSTAPR